MAIAKVILNGTTLMDITQDTVTAPTLKQGETAHGANGEEIVGTMSGDGGGATDGDVIFLDYDGTVVAAKSKAEINAMTSDSDLPANPTHTGLTAQGWNWTVAQLKTQLTAMPDQIVYVGQMYVTESGKTEIDVTMPEGRLSPILTIAVNGTVSIDWGDDTVQDTVTGTDLTTRIDVEPHNYASAGNYTIKISVTNGSFAFYCGSSSYALLRKNSTQNENKVYANCVKKIRLGTGISIIGTYAFINCYSLESVTLTRSVTSIGTYVFQNCYSLKSLTIPSGVTSIEERAFQNCYSLDSVTFPSGMTSIGSTVFSACYSLASVTFPSGMTSIASSAFSNCQSIVSISIPSGVTSIGTSVFTSCISLASVTIPSGVTSIGDRAFNGCSGVKEYHILPTTVPTLVTTSFNNIVSDCVIYVPRSENQTVLNAYKTASNWSTYASYMQEEPA